MELICCLKSASDDIWTKNLSFAPKNIFKKSQRILNDVSEKKVPIKILAGSMLFLKIVKKLITCVSIRITRLAGAIKLKVGQRQWDTSDSFNIATSIEF